MFSLSELENDALIEIFNIGVGQAAASMSAIVNEAVRMSVPSVSFINRTEAARLLNGKSPEAESICGVSQHYEGAFATEAILMFPEDKSLEIVRLMVGESVPLKELTEMEQEAMCEIGNIILNSCVGTLANIFQHELHGSLPQYHIGTSDEILVASGSLPDTVVLMLHIDFLLEKHQIHGYVAFVLDVSALHDLKEQINLYIARAMGQA
ncbi:MULTISPECIES: chemotaxis protein CheC [unclassified Duganella]|uniref:chemotaxis protein CheC n=1 Tax=unclassified Duganella TaxID=2636909 RepID=UPI000E3497E5|nr:MULTISPECIES: chemotaxis protein CheC [unclassified Duganella]RFP14743.1 chemotaxis protein CheC [Duganella sp. BJB475]RFP31092.1 chemotaxis protein CheC [Duganella sp. BJB476]